MKILQYISVALIGISLVAGCGPKQVKPWDNTSLGQITFSFTDTDDDEGEIAGDITLDLSAALKPAEVTHYVIYWSGSADSTGKGDMMAEIAVADFTGPVLYTVAENTSISGKYFLLYLRGTKGKELFSGKASIVADKFEGAVIPDVVDVTQPPVPKGADQPQVVAQPGPDVYIVTIKNVLFEFDKSFLKSEFKKKLRNDFADTQNKDQVKLLIAGHADERGSNEYNLALGERRAFSVKRYLISLGFLADNIRIISYGEEKPLDPAHNEEAWTKNRRAETKIQD